MTLIHWFFSWGFLWTIVSGALNYYAGKLVAKHELLRPSATCRFCQWRKTRISWTKKIEKFFYRWPKIGPRIVSFAMLYWYVDTMRENKGFAQELGELNSKMGVVKNGRQDMSRVRQGK